MPRGKIISLIISIRKQESIVSLFIFHLEKLEKLNGMWEAGLESA